MNAWELWGQNWRDASNFFNSKGNIQTKARLKEKWHDNFVKNIKWVKERS